MLKLLQVIKLTAGSVMADELNITALIEKMFTELVHTTKYTSTGKQILCNTAKMQTCIVINNNIH